MSLIYGFSAGSGGVEYAGSWSASRSKDGGSKRSVKTLNAIRKRFHLCERQIRRYSLNPDHPLHVVHYAENKCHKCLKASIDLPYTRALCHFQKDQVIPPAKARVPSTRFKDL